VSKSIELSLLLLLQATLVSAQDAACTLPEVGETRVYKVTDYAFSPRRYHYLLKRILSTDDKPSLEVIVAVKYKGKKMNVEGAEAFKKKSNACFEEFSPYLIGPQGEHLKIRVATTEEIEAHHLIPTELGLKKLRSNPIRVVDKESKFYKKNQNGVYYTRFRENARKYHRLTQCDVILHETLHLLGLVDEYKELELPYDCRSLGPQDSVMKDQSVARGSIHSSCNEKKYLINCSYPYKVYEDSYKAIVEEFDQQVPLYRENKTLPVFKNCELEEQHPDLESVFGIGDCGKVGQGGVDISLGLGFKDNVVNSSNMRACVNIFYNVPPKRDSLLRKGHFNKIVYPHCKKLNELYDACARNAYRSTAAGCYKTPADCSDPSWVDQ